MALVHELHISADPRLLLLTCLKNPGIFKESTYKIVYFQNTPPNYLFLNLAASSLPPVALPSE